MYKEKLQTTFACAHTNIKDKFIIESYFSFLTTKKDEDQGLVMRYCVKTIVCVIFSRRGSCPKQNSNVT